MFLAMIYTWMRSLSAEQICSRYIEEDASAPVILVVVTAAALLSLIAIVEPLATLRHVVERERIWHFMLAAATLIDSWLLVPTMFTTHYADMFYSTERTDRPLSFPQTEMPVFWDFAYFSFVLGMTFQVSDVQVTSPTIRKLALAHGLISFAYNTSIIALVVNVAASLLQG